ncbi:hypothetical protein KAT80_03895 [Candidatus Pacearchaeota archaeon]|nr:hypothetical protein [Candidatus Pacearchaeota archaeon]
MEQMNIIQVNKEIIALKSQMNEIMKFIYEDLEFARGTEEAWQEIDEGKCKCMSKDEFLNEIEKW